MNLENVEDLYPLSPVQQGMLFHSLAAPHSGVYIGQCTCKLQGTLEPELLKRAWQTVIDRHTVLRTMFVWELDEPLQLVRQQVELPWHEEDWRDCPNPTADWEDFLARDRAKGFALDAAPLTSITLVRLADDTYRLVWTCHHAIVDGWSTPAIWNEIYAIYTAFRDNRPHDLPEPKPYRDYIAWLQEQDDSLARQFWTKALDGFAEPTPLPGARRIQDGAGVRWRSRYLPADLFASLQTFCRSHRLTLSTLVNGAWALLLSRYSSAEDVVFGTVVSGRSATISDVESRVGLFVNTLPMRVAIAESDSLVPWLKSLQDRALNIRNHETTSLSDIQTWCEIPAGENLFQSLVVFENRPAAPHTHALGFEVSDIDARDQSNYPFVLLAIPGEILELKAIFDSHLFPDEAAERILEQVETVLKGFVKSPQAELANISLLTASERQLLLHDWNQTQASLPEAKCIHHLIEAQADRVPDAVAIAYERQLLTYSELDRRANQ
ncbi:MAG: condensation domain-containing protein, partial [Cyanobacteria bacterium J06639_1]